MYIKLEFHGEKGEPQMRIDIEPKSDAADITEHFFSANRYGRGLVGCDLLDKEELEMFARTLGSISVSILGALRLDMDIYFNQQKE